MSRMTTPDCTDDHASGFPCPAHPGAAEATGPMKAYDLPPLELAEGDVAIGYAMAYEER